MSIADAPSHKPIAWQTIDWAAVQRTVRRLQVRIVKQPYHPGLGQLPQTCCQQASLPTHRLPDPPVSLEMGHTSPQKQVSWLGLSTVHQTTGGAESSFPSLDHRQTWGKAFGPYLSGQPAPHPSSHQGSGSGQPLRPPVGVVLRAATAQ